MLKVDWSKFQSRTSRSPHLNSGVGIVVYPPKKDRNGKLRSETIQLNICPDAMRHFRWGIGDRIEFAVGEFDGVPCFAMRRTQGKGTALSSTNSSKGASEKYAGKPVRASARKASYGEFAEFDKVSVPLSEIIECDGVFIITLKEAKHNLFAAT